MTPVSPIVTVWPVWVVALMWLWLCWRHRRTLSPTVPVLLAGAVVLALRLWGVPALEAHLFDGHEAEYWDLFRGEQRPTRGGTVMVPAMQWFWWLLGRALPAWPELPVVIMAVVGTLSVGLLGGAFALLGGPRAGAVAAAVVAVSPAHIAWSSSAYNVILPFFFCSMAIYSAAWCARQPRLSRSMQAWVGTSLVLALSTRMDTGMVAVLVALLVLVEARRASTVMELLWAWSPAGLLTILVGGACIWPMIWPGGLPGDGERGAAFFNNLMFFEVYGPLSSTAGLAVMLLSLVTTLKVRPRLAGVLGTFLVLHHLLMVTFDDFGERHALVALPALAGVIGLATWHPAGWLSAGAALLLNVSAIPDLRERFYGSEDVFSMHLDREYSALPRVDISTVPPPQCGWVAEDQRVAADPIASHFNVLHPEEEARLRGPSGCLRWCLDVHDWRWSSRGVRDRALRLSHLFVLTPRHVVTDPGTGYACLVMDIGQRTVPIPGTKIEDDEAALRGDQPVP